MAGDCPHCGAESVFDNGFVRSWLCGSSSHTYGSQSDWWDQSDICSSFSVRRRQHLRRMAGEARLRWYLAVNIAEIGPSSRRALYARHAVRLRRLYDACRAALGAA